MLCCNLKFFLKKISWKDREKKVHNDVIFLPKLNLSTLPQTLPTYYKWVWQWYLEMMMEEFINSLKQALVQGALELLEPKCTRIGMI
jgi:hypothetical protein